MINALNYFYPRLTALKITMLLLVVIGLACCDSDGCRTSQSEESDDTAAIWFMTSQM